MLSEERIKNKENIYKIQTSGKNEAAYLMQSTVQGLKQQIQRLTQQKNMIKKQSIGQIDILRLQLQQYKKKLSSLTDKYLLQTFMRNKDNQYESASLQNQQIIRQKQILYSQELQKGKRKQEEIRKLIQQNCKLKKQKSLLCYEKQRAMEISLTQKIQIQQKNKLLEEQVKSKKTIISNLKKELQKVYSNRQDIIKKQRAIQQKSKELQCFSNQVNEYNRLSETKFKQKLQHLGKQNEFLKSYIKKLQKMAKKNCECEAKDQKVKENLFEIKRQLALAKVRLGQTFLKSKKIEKKAKKQEGTQSDEEADDF